MSLTYLLRSLYMHVMVPLLLEGPAVAQAWSDVAVCMVVPPHVFRLYHHLTSQSKHQSKIGNDMKHDKRAEEFLQLKARRMCYSTDDLAHHYVGLPFVYYTRLSNAPLETSYARYTTGPTTNMTTTTHSPKPGCQSPWAVLLERKRRDDSCTNAHKQSNS